jgi:beta-fructofuranosidase
MAISHNVGGRAYVGRLEGDSFVPERHVRMNWPGGNYFAPESLVDDRGRRIVWAWITDPRSITTQVLTGSGVQSLPRLVGLDPEGGLTIDPVPEIERLRGPAKDVPATTLDDGREVILDGIEGDSLDLELVIEPDGGEGLPPVLTDGTRQIVVTVLASPDGRERTRIVFDVVAGTLSIDATSSTLRRDVNYQFHPLDSGGVFHDRAPGEPHRCPVTTAPLVLAPGEPLRLVVDQAGVPRR